MQLPLPPIVLLPVPPRSADAGARSRWVNTRLGGCRERPLLNGLVARGQRCLSVHRLFRRCLCTRRRAFPPVLPAQRVRPSAAVPPAGSFPGPRRRWWASLQGLPDASGLCGSQPGLIVPSPAVSHVDHRLPVWPRLLRTRERVSCRGHGARVPSSPRKGQGPGSRAWVLCLCTNLRFKAQN